MLIFAGIIFVVILIVITSLIEAISYPVSDNNTDGNMTLFLGMLLTASIGSFLVLWLVFHFTWWIALLIGVVAGVISYYFSVELWRRIRFNSKRKFEYHFTKIANMFNVLGGILITIPLQPESKIKDSQSLYSTYVALKGHWHALEVTYEYAVLWIKKHFEDDHWENHFSYVIQSDGRGQVNVIASTGKVGLQHFVWRSENNHFILLLSDDKS